MSEEVREEARNEEEVRLPLSEHLEELRKRLIRSLLALGVGAGLCYNWSEDIYEWLLRPLFIHLPGNSGIIFELPLMLYLLGRAGILTPALLRKGRKVAVLGVLLLAAVLTPPDVASQILIAIPLYILYEAGILLCAMGAHRHKARLQA